jgi:hypothetical protein
MSHKSFLVHRECVMPSRKQIGGATARFPGPRPALKYEQRSGGLSAKYPTVGYELHSDVCYRGSSLPRDGLHEVVLGDGGVRILEMSTCRRTLFLMPSTHACKW